MGDVKPLFAEMPHPKITAPGSSFVPLRVYSQDDARALHKGGAISGPTLSDMKQANIAAAAIEISNSDMFISPSVLYAAMGGECGLCFDVAGDGYNGCDGCPIDNHLGTSCFSIWAWDQMEQAETVNEFIGAHIRWLQLIGLKVPQLYVDEWVGEVG